MFLGPVSVEDARLVSSSVGHSVCSICADTTFAHDWNLAGSDDVGYVSKRFCL